MEANSFQMCQGTRAEPREPALQRTPAVAGRLEGTGPLDRDFRIAKAAGQILAQKLHANACVRGEGDPPGCTCRAPGKPLPPAALRPFFCNIQLLLYFHFYVERPPSSPTPFQEKFSVNTNYV